MESIQDYLSKVENHYLNLNQFKQLVKLNLNGREERLTNIEHNGKKLASVLMPIIYPKTLTNGQKFSLDQIYLLLEKRSSHLSKNPGDLAFPGGSVDSTDKTLVDTAYREAEEEVGINPNSLEFISYMDEFVSSSGIIVRTIVSFMELDLPIENFRKTVEEKFYPRTEETDKTIVIPFSHLLNPTYYSSTEYNSKSGRIGYIRYFNIDPFSENEHIWGMTATMIRRFLDIMFPDNLLIYEPI